MKTLQQHAISNLKEQFSGTIITPTDAEYDDVRGTYAVTDARPALIARAASTNDIVTAIRFATTHSLPFSIRSGGHHAAGFSTNNDGLVLDLSHLNSIEILDEKAGLVRLGTGALWGDVANALGKRHLAISSGDTKSVGVGGLTLGGGIGWMMRQYGYAIDSLVGAEIVLADGSIVKVSEHENDDLFWAIRGGGGNFGVVTSFDFRAHPQGNVVSHTVTYAPDELTKIVSGWREYMKVADESITSFMTLLPSFGPSKPVIMVMSCYAGDDEEKAAALFRPLETLAAPTSTATAVIPYAEMLQEAHPPKGVQFTAKNMYAKTLEDDIVAILDTICCKPGSPIVQLRMVNGAASRIDPQATALAHRTSEVFLFAGFPAPLDATKEQIAQGLEKWDKLAQYSVGAYPNFISTNTERDVADIYPQETYKRLADIKRQYDPENIFNHNFNIKPTGERSY